MSEAYRKEGDDITDTRILEARDNVEMMRSPHLWPIKDILPLKKRGRDAMVAGNLGYIRRDPARPHRVYYGVIGFVAHRYEDFRSFEDIAAAGWVVD